MELESDRFQHLSYAEAAFQTEAGAVYGEYRKTRTDPEFALYEELVGTAFERHPYGHTTLGYERDIAIMPTLYEYSRDFFSRYYRPENTVLFIAGDVTPANVFALVEKHYGGWQRGYVPPQIPVEPEQTAERRVDVGYDGQTLPLLLVRLQAARLRRRRPHARRRRSLRRPRVRRDQRGVSAARARRAGRRGPRRGRGVQPRSRPARDHGAHQGPEQGRLRARRHRRDDRAVPRDAARRAAARGSAAAAALRLPHGSADAGRRRVARGAVHRAHPAICTGSIGCMRPTRRSRRPTCKPRPNATCARSAAPSACSGRGNEPCGAHRRRHARRLRRAAAHPTSTPPPATPEPEDATVVLLNVPADPTISLSVQFAVGSQNDPPGKEGLAFLTGEMLADAATETRSLDEILAALYPLAASYGMRVDLERTTLTGRVHRDNLDGVSRALYRRVPEARVRRGRLRARAQRRDQRDREHAALLVRRGARQGRAARASCFAARPTRT